MTDKVPFSKTPKVSFVTDQRIFRSIFRDNGLVLALFKFDGTTRYKRTYDCQADHNRKNFFHRDSLLLIAVLLYPKSNLAILLYHTFSQRSIGRLEFQAVLGLFFSSAVFHPSAALVKGGVAGVEILGIQVVLGDAEGVAEPLVMHDLPLPEELDRLADVGVVAQAENVVVGHPRLLLC